MATATAKKAPARKRVPAGRKPAAESVEETTPARKAPARKAATKAPARKTATKAAATKVAPARKAPVRKRAAAAVTEEATPRRGRVRDTNVLGFVDGTDSALIAEALVLGGTDRKNVNVLATDRVTAVNGIATRNGEPKNIPSLVSGVSRRLREAGFTVESTFRMVPPKNLVAKVDEHMEGVKAAMATEKRRAARARGKAARGTK